MATAVDAVRAKIPAAFRAFVASSSDIKQRRLVASAAVPMPPEVLLHALLVLCHDPDEGVRSAASNALQSQPEALLESLIKASTDPHFLGLLVDVFRRSTRARTLTALLINSVTPDESVAQVARSCPGPITELIGGNQVRLIRHPAIIKSLYFNERTPMATVTRVIETAVRNDVDLSHLPGAERIKQSIMGALEGEDQAEDPGEPGAAAPPEAGDPATDDSVAPQAASLDAASIDDDEFMRLLAEAAQEEGVADSSLFDAPEAAEDERKSIWALVRDMSISQKVRMALVGNMSARAVLIRDAKKLVTQAVLDSPRLTEREVQDFARNKALGEDIIRRIAYNRDWAKNMATQRALVGHPKCPPQKAMEFVKNLSIKSLKELQRDRDVPVHVARQAKNLLAQREQRSGGKR